MGGFRIARDHDPDNPNPHALYLDEGSCETEDEARAAAEADDAQALVDYEGDAERAGVGNWIVVYDPSP